MGKTAAENEASKMFSADVVAAVLMATGTTSLSMKQYEMMSALDGTRTASSFQHVFRAVIAKSKELKARVDEGEVFEPVQPVVKRGNTNKTVSPMTPKKRKNVNAGDEDITPCKKKATPGKKVTDTSTENTIGGGEMLPHDTDDFIKKELEWENIFG
ncbi:hypothetical protein GQ44DRAFT_765947 [Phaeosphaeriaceae sp. PMI808]|nr:hypothetical protein GQ44DRAFT_765947 [Phaeosphaeriaceae sp. PMI808]